MNKKEMREVTITYCDYCGKEITPPYATIEFKDGLKVDLCSDYRDGEKTCKEKYREAATRDNSSQVGKDEAERLRYQQYLHSQKLN